METANSGSPELSQGCLISHCPAQLSLEHGELRSPSFSMFWEYLCSMARSWPVIQYLTQ